ncbi:hypothetical protein B7P43_G02936 [Cryptotermes secundus]|uniref:Uncharacterized protein n=1 Tax=Cryptotermes secundus TaxID=105785 RepID=A0A2J7Q147_9NEOP|nr:uncharacterized protein LOC111870558 [Cryptotermes secundus]PNF22311.1 hypothetical protein B7P43_G02936 [Cryptotermes secundus]
MSRGCAPVLPLLLSTGILLYLISMVDAVPGPLDCRRFVFAPKCRGVAAKRGFPPANRAGYLLDTDRKMDGLEEVLGLYATSQPIAVLQQSDNRGQQGRGFATRGRSGQAWSSAGDQQGLKTDTFYDWYLSNRKRTRDNDVTYDY